MIALLLALAGATPAPTLLTVSTAKGVERIPVVQHEGAGLLVSLSRLAQAVNGTVLRQDPWTVLETSAGRFRFLTGTPVVDLGTEVRGLPGRSFRRSDSIFVPLAFVSEILADPRRRAWSWTPGKALLTEGPAAAPLRTLPSTTTVGADARARLPDGLRSGHRVTIDAGHGGTDPGNPGLYFPDGLKEKDVTLAMALRLRDELERRGVRVTMTRTRDVLIPLTRRAPDYCREGCDLFVSLHVNSLPRRTGYTKVRGFETYYLAEARTADAARVAKMENEALRFDPPGDDPSEFQGLGFLLKDLQVNESQRESALAADIVQQFLAEVHPGTNRGVHPAGFAVLTTARRPAILVEMGYSTNPADATLMTSPLGQKNLANAMADAIVEYLRKFDRKTADSSQPPTGP